MRILDETSGKSINNLVLLFKKTEAIQLIGYLEALVSDETNNEHYHLNNDDYSKEITIALYDTNTINNFSDRYKRLIIKDE